MYADLYLPSALFQTLGAEVTPSYFKPASTFPAQLSEFPASYEDLMALDLIALINVDVNALGDAGQEMLKDFVQHGGTLVYGGDFYAYGRGNVKASAVAELLPVSLAADQPANGLQYLKGEPVRKADGASLDDHAVMVYAGEAFTVKPGAEVLLTCHNQPVLVSWKVGAGRVVAITGTVLGVAPNDKTLFTQTSAWTSILSGCINLK